MKCARNQKGMATLEALPLLVIFVVFVAFSLGSFGIIHTAILNSIAARTYAFETFRHRTNLTYLRENFGAATETFHYRRIGNRIHAVLGEGGASGNRFVASERPISMGLQSRVVSRDNEAVHNERIFNEISVAVQNERVEVNPVWVMIQYGICLRADCK